MIEMRWLNASDTSVWREEFEKYVAGAMVPSNPLKKLQYRHLVAGVDNGEMKMFAGSWSEWKDVPVAKIEDLPAV